MATRALRIGVIWLRIAAGIVASAIKLLSALRSSGDNAPATIRSFSALHISEWK
jgi:hypothetical protein